MVPWKPACWGLPVVHSNMNVEHLEFSLCPTLYSSTSHLWKLSRKHVEVDVKWVILSLSRNSVQVVKLAYKVIQGIDHSHPSSWKDPHTILQAVISPLLNSTLLMFVSMNSSCLLMNIILIESNRRYYCVLNLVTFIRSSVLSDVSILLFHCCIIFH